MLRLRGAPPPKLRRTWHTRDARAGREINLVGEFPVRAHTSCVPCPCISCVPCYAAWAAAPHLEGEFPVRAQKDARGAQNSRLQRSNFPPAAHKVSACGAPKRMPAARQNLRPRRAIPRPRTGGRREAPPPWFKAHRAAKRGEWEVRAPELPQPLREFSQRAAGRGGGAPCRPNRRLSPTRFQHHTDGSLDVCFSLFLLMGGV